MAITTAHDLGKAIKRGESRIEIEGDLKNWVIRIKMIGPVAWVTCGVFLGGAIYFALATPAATVATTPAGGAITFGSSAVAGTAAATFLGIPAATAAVVIGVAAGGIGGITSLRDKYRIETKTNNLLVLVRK